MIGPSATIMGNKMKYLYWRSHCTTCVKEGSINSHAPRREEKLNFNPSLSGCPPQFRQPFVPTAGHGAFWLFHVIFLLVSAQCNKINVGIAFWVCGVILTIRSSCCEEPIVGAFRFTSAKLDWSIKIMLHLSNAKTSTRLSKNGKERPHV
jgi:hypothetical protein